MRYKTVVTLMVIGLLMSCSNKPQFDWEQMGKSKLEGEWLITPPLKAEGHLIHRIILSDKKITLFTETHEHIGAWSYGIDHVWFISAETFLTKQYRLARHFLNPNDIIIIDTDDDKSYTLRRP